MIKVADNRRLSAQAVGTAILPLHDTHGKTHHITLHNVIYHPNFHTNLLSVRRLWLDNHIMCRFDPHNYLHNSSGIRFPIAYDKRYISSHAAYVSSLRIVDDDIIHARFSLWSYILITSIADDLFYYNLLFSKLRFLGVWYLRFGTWYIWHFYFLGHSPILDCCF